MPKTCCFILKPATSGSPAEYCGKPTKYERLKDEDGTTYILYKSLCLEHEIYVKRIIIDGIKEDPDWDFGG